MCEIYALDPNRIAKTNALFVAKDMFDSNSDGLGAIAVYRGHSSYEYEAFAQTSPTWQEFDDWLAAQYENEAWRVIIHARLATTGENSDRNTHPLEVGEGADVEYIIHNGVVRNHEQVKAAAERGGHTYATDVDSESIAHYVGKVPETTDDITGNNGLQGRLNYILFAENGILVHNTGKYELRDDFTMTTCSRDERFDGATSDMKWMLIKPFNAIYTVEVENYGRSRRGYSRSGTSTGSPYRASSTENLGAWGAGISGKSQGRSRSSRSSSQTGESNEMGNPEADEVTRLVDEEGNVVGEWEWDNENNPKYKDDYDDAKEDYGSRYISVHEDELGMVLEPDTRVPEGATGMYADEDDDGEYFIEWWNLNNPQENGRIEVDRVYRSSEQEGEEEVCELTPESDTGNGRTVLSGNENENSESKHGESSRKRKSEGTVTGDFEEDSHFWQGHFGPTVPSMSD